MKTIHLARRTLHHYFNEPEKETVFAMNLFMKKKMNQKLTREKDTMREKKKGG